MTVVPKVKYITNRELLLEIHRSKTSYCYFLDPKYADFDGIVNNVDEITPDYILKIKTKKATKAKTPLEDFQQTEFVIRVMTCDHVPIDPNRKRKHKVTGLCHTRTNFPAFKHYLFDETTGHIQEVGRSHWVGGFENGHFVMDTGRITRRLAEMFMTLVDRYSKRGNWRGYTYVDEMRSHALMQLSQEGLQFDESKSDNPFAFYTTTIRNCFTRVLNTERKNQNIRDDMLIMSGATPSFTRQVDNEMEQRSAASSEEGAATAPARRGPKPKVKVTA